MNFLVPCITTLKRLCNFALRPSSEKEVCLNMHMGRPDDENVILSSLYIHNIRNLYGKLCHWREDNVKKRVLPLKIMEKTLIDLE